MVRLKTKTQSVNKTDYYAVLNNWTIKEIKKVLKSRKLTTEQKDVISNYYSSLLDSRKNSSILTILRSVYDFADYVKKPFAQVTKEDILNYMKFKRVEQEVMQSTLNAYLINIRAFFKWLYQTDEYPDVVKGIKPKRYVKAIKEEDLITKDDMESFLKALGNSRDRALLMLIWDSGARLRCEILTAKIKNLIFDEYGARLSVEGKTGHRNIRLIESVPYLKKWIDDEHPSADDPEAPLFVNKKTDECLPLGYQSVLVMLRMIARKTKFRKPINPHNFRHSKVTQTVKDGFVEAELRVMYGWSKDSDMPHRYTHISEKTVNDKILEKSGLLVKKDKAESDKKLKPKICPRCREINPSNNKYCKCGLLLDVRSEFRQENRVYDVLAKLIQDPEKAKKLADLVKDAL